MVLAFNAETEFASPSLLLFLFNFLFISFWFLYPSAVISLIFLYHFIWSWHLMQRGSLRPKILYWLSASGRPDITFKQTRKKKAWHFLKECLCCELKSNFLKESWMPKTSAEHHENYDINFQMTLCRWLVWHNFQTSLQESTNIWIKNWLWVPSIVR